MELIRLICMYAALHVLLHICCDMLRFESRVTLRVFNMTQMGYRRL